ncbi:unnamed protein product [Arctia plantaginis]|uniref:Uncharacterized protein n=1 Tax=Arctia plantaginis TaxID=874455 RepID=A0A8S1BTK7_ARCPL|nr:unnamed protein product [Arctia plantaginis]
MDSEIMVESLPLLGTCNLCLEEGVVKSMILAQQYKGNTEIYSDMLIKCFSIDIATLHLGDTKPLICNTCISKLRDSADFKQQVLASLDTLERMVKVNKEEKHSLGEAVKKENSVVADVFDDDFPIDDDVHIEKKKNSLGEEVKKENSVASDDFDDDFHDDDDMDIDLKTIIKKEKEHEFSRKTRSKSVASRKIKLSKYPLKKTIDLSETEAMLKIGLFPFKIKKNRSFSCSICPEKSSNLDDIKTHIVDHNKTNINLAFKKMMSSNSHRFYKSAINLRCKMCTTDVSNYEELKQHIENCTRLKFTNRKFNNLPFKLEKDQVDCPVCKKTFLNYVNLNTHMNIHYPNYICESCGKAFASKARLRAHMRTHEVGTFPCRYCEQIFDRVTKRENHVSKEHKSGVRYACKRCNISLTSFYARQKHLAEVHNEELKRYKCKACPQSYITPGHLSSHVRRDHLNERNHKCDKCDLAFYTKNALKMHMIKHDGERIHICPVCQKSYQRKKTLREHLRIHNNDKRFVCPVCGRAFTQKCTLKGHLKVHERQFDEDDRVPQPLHSI